MRRVTRKSVGVALFCLPLIACGEEVERIETPDPPPQRRAASNDDDERETVDDRVAAMMESSERQSFATHTRDPFTQPRPQRGAGSRGRVEAERNCDTNAEPLGKVELENIEVMGLMTGTAVPRAMVIANGNPQAVIVTEGALAGPDCSQRLIDIRDNQIVFEQITQDEGSRAETVLELTASRISDRFLSIEDDE